MITDYSKFVTKSIMLTQIQMCYYSQQQLFTSSFYYWLSTAMLRIYFSKCMYYVHVRVVTGDNRLLSRFKNAINSPLLVKVSYELTTCYNSLHCVHIYSVLSTAHTHSHTHASASCDIVNVKCQYFVFTLGSYHFI